MYGSGEFVEHLLTTCKYIINIQFDGAITVEQNHFDKLMSLPCDVNNMCSAVLAVVMLDYDRRLQWPGHKPAS